MYLQKNHEDLSEQPRVNIHIRVLKSSSSRPRHLRRNPQRRALQKRQLLRKSLQQPRRRKLSAAFAELQNKMTIPMKLGLLATSAPHGSITYVWE